MNRIELVSNAGLFIELDGVKILVDAFVGESHPPYRTMPREIFDRLMADDAVDYLIYTHYHPDQCCAFETARYLAEHNSRVIAGQETADALMQAGIPKERILRAGEGITRFEGGLAITAFPTRHLGIEYVKKQHDSFLIEGSRRIVITGDATPVFSNFTLEDQPIGPIDVLAATYPFATGNRSMRLYKLALQPRIIFITHLPDRSRDEASEYEMIEEARAEGRPFEIFVPEKPGAFIEL